MSSAPLTHVMRRALAVAATLSTTLACAGEPPPPVDTALANSAVCDTAGARVVESFDTTGVRLRDVPFTPDRVRFSPRT